MDFDREKAKKEKIAQVSEAGANAFVKMIFAESEADENIFEYLSKKDDETQRVFVKTSPFGLELVLQNSQVQCWRLALGDFLKRAQNAKTVLELVKIADELNLDVAGKNAVHYAFVRPPEQIENSAFFRSELKSCYIEEGICEIGDQAFLDNRELNAVFLPKSLRELAWFSFEECNSLEFIQYGGTLLDWESVEDKRYILETTRAFCVNCTDGVWKKPLILTGTKNIAKCCLDKSAISVEIPDGIEIIGKHAFIWCTDLKSVIIPKSVHEICSFAFEGCRELKKIVYSGTVKQWSAVQKSGTSFDDVAATVVSCSDGEKSIK